MEIGAHQRALHHNLDPHHGKRPQAPGLEDLAQSAHSQRHRRHTLPFHALPLAPPPVGSLMDRNAAREYWMEVRMRTRVRMRAERRDVRAKYVKRRKMETLDRQSRSVLSSIQVKAYACRARRFEELVRLAHSQQYWRHTLSPSVLPLPSYALPPDQFHIRALEGRRLDRDEDIRGDREWRC